MKKAVPGSNRFPHGRCPQCDSRRLVTDVQLQRRGGGVINSLMRLVAFAKPENWLFKGKAESELRACVCGDCGFTHFYAADPDALYDAYEKAQQKAQQQRLD